MASYTTLCAPLNPLSAPLAPPTPAAALAAATAFLTSPLVPLLPRSKLLSLQATLHTILALTTTIPNAKREYRLVLALPLAGHALLAPPQIQAAARAEALNAAAWMQALLVSSNNRSFEVIIEPRAVVVEYDCVGQREIEVLWCEAVEVRPAVFFRPSFASSFSSPLSFPTQPQTQNSPPMKLSELTLSQSDDEDVQEPEVPISKYSQKAGITALRATLDSARARHTLAPVRFATRQHRDGEVVGFRAHTEETSEDSRPSSRSSAISSHSSTVSFSSSASFSSSGDDDYEFTPASSVVSLELDCFDAKPTFLDSRPARAQAQAQRRATLNNAPPAPAKVVVDNTKKDVTKYLYQGGVSTVLTGGVMLGSGAGSANSKKTAFAFTPRAAPRMQQTTPKNVQAATKGMPKPIGHGRWAAAAAAQQGQVQTPVRGPATVNKLAPIGTGRWAFSAPSTTYSSTTQTPLEQAIYRAPPPPSPASRRFTGLVAPPAPIGSGRKMGMGMGMPAPIGEGRWAARARAAAMAGAC